MRVCTGYCPRPDLLCLTSLVSGSGQCCHSGVRQGGHLVAPEIRYAKSGDVHIAYQVHLIHPFPLAFIARAHKASRVRANRPDQKLLGA